MTAVIVALLTLPLAAMRPFQQPTAERAATAATTSGTAVPAIPESFKVSISQPPAPPASPATTSEQASSATLPAPKPIQAVTPSSAWSCDSYSRRGRSGTHISHHDGDGTAQILNYVVSSGSRCAEAALVGRARFSADESRIAELSPGGFARFRERTEAVDRAVSVTPAADGSLSYTALMNGRTVAFDETMQAWLARFLPEVLREAAINVPERVARLRDRGGIPAVLSEVGQIRSTGAKRAHYEEILKTPLSAGDAEKVTTQAGRDLVASSGDLSAVIQQLPRSSMRTSQTRQAVAGALSQIRSSGDKSSTLRVLAPHADAEMLIVLARAAEDLPSSGDKANFLIATASEYLTPGTESLRNAFFKTASTLQSSGDMANVLISSIPYGHSSSAVALQVVATSKGLASSGDAANVLLSLISQRAVQPGNTRATLAIIERTLTMASSGDRANVLISLATTNLVSNSELREAFTKAAMALPSDGDRANVLAAAARR